MHAIVANLIAGILLLQAVTGACWQAAEICEDSLCTRVTSHSGCCGDRCHEKDSETPPSEPCKLNLKCSGICTYTLPDQVPQLALSDLWVEVVFADSLLSAGTAHDVALARDLSGPIPTGQTRLHLLHQVILI